MPHTTWHSFHQSRSAILEVIWQQHEEEYLFRQKQKQNLSTNIIKYRDWFPEGHTPIVLDALTNAENDRPTSNIIC